jgi:hypothetical protein
MPKKSKSNTKIPAKDNCQTPPYALDPLMPYLPKDDSIIWESACGEGLLVDSLLRDWGYKVVWSDINRDIGEDFFIWNPKKWDIQITNPPFSLKYKWLARSYELGKPFALLMPVDVIAASSAQKLFKKYGIEILLLNKRVDFKMPNKGWEGNGAQFSVAWFCWRLNIGRELTYMCEIDKT